MFIPRFYFFFAGEKTEGAIIVKLGFAEEDDGKTEKTLI